MPAAKSRLALPSALSFGLLLFVNPSYAADTESPVDSDVLNSTEVKAVSSDPWQWLQAPRDVLARNVTGLGRSLDTWLSGEGIGEQQNGTFLRLRLYQESSSIEGYNSQLNVGGRLDLPGASKRFKLIFESNVDELESLNDSLLGDSDAGIDIGGFRYEHPRGRNWTISHDIGLRAEVPADPFYRFRANYIKELSPDWSIGLKQKLWYYDSEGAGYDTQIFFSKQMQHSRFLQITSRINYKEKRGSPEIAQIVALHHSLGDQETITYEAGVLGRSRKSGEITDHYVQLRYRKAIYQDWLILELAPQILASAEYRWQTEFRLTANLDILFFDF